MIFRYSQKDTQTRPLFMYNETLVGVRGGSNHTSHNPRAPSAREGGTCVITSDLVVIHERPIAINAIEPFGRDCIDCYWP